MTLRWIWAGAMLATILVLIVVGKVPYRKSLETWFTLHYVRRDTEPFRFWAIIGFGLIVTLLVWMEGPNSN
jgi:multisubunit Na+/H+ antiporter MnhB subunit